jgi:hypothetical protein
MSRIVCVTGGRLYDDQRTVFKTLDRLHGEQKITRVVHGGADGADNLAEKWARSRSVPTTAWPVSPMDWKTMGLAAGPIRNGNMLKGSKPDLVVAFPGGKGTADCTRQARRLGITIEEVP